GYFSVGESFFSWKSATISYCNASLYSSSVMYSKLYIRLNTVSIRLIPGCKCSSFFNPPVLTKGVYADGLCGKPAKQADWAKFKSFSATPTIPWGAHRIPAILLPDESLANGTTLKYAYKISSFSEIRSNPRANRISFAFLSKDTSFVNFCFLI